jgi:nucleoside-diphosphate-sugar epimerase
MGSHLKILDLNGVQGVETELLDHHSLHEAAEGTDTIYSMASPMPGSDTDFERINPAIARNVVEVAEEAGIKTLVHLSTLDVYGFGRGTVDITSTTKPSDQYQRSKMHVDETLIEFAKRKPSIRVVVIRAARGVGPRDETLTIPLLRMIEKRKVVVPKGPIISFSHPKDIAQAMFKCASNPSVPSGVYLVKSFDSTANEVARALSAAIGTSLDPGHGGLFSRQTLPHYTLEQMKGSPSVKQQESWKSIGYSPGYDLESTCKDIALWYGKERWVTANS